MSGLAGTGSHDFVVNDVFVPGDGASLDGEACVDGPLHRIPELSYSALGIAAVAVGIAQGAVDDILLARRGEGTGLHGGDPGVEPAVPEPVRGDRRPPGGPGAARRLRRPGMGAGGGTRHLT